jgi:hypothetical protein
MASRTLVQVLAARRYITLAGLVLSLILGSTAYFVTPKTYTSSGTAVLMKQNGPNSINPLLAFPADDSLNITTLILVQLMNEPRMAADLGLADGQETFTLKNGGSSAVKIDGIPQPFVTIAAESVDPARSTQIVGDVLARTQQELSALQSEMRVPRGEEILLADVVDATPPTFGWDAQARAVAVALLLGISLTIATAYACDTRTRRRTRWVAYTNEDAQDPVAGPDTPRHTPNGSAAVSAISGEDPR